MKFEFFISLKYLFSKKRYGAIQIISLVSVIGVAIGTTALVVILSVFNGLDDVIKSMYNAFDPDLKITIKEGKFFEIDSARLMQIKKIPGVDDVALTAEETVLIQYAGRQYIAALKGVSDNYLALNQIKYKLTDGDAQIMFQNRPYALVGQGVAYYLGINLNLYEPLQIYMPRRSDDDFSLDPENAFNRGFIQPSGFFSIEQDIDNKYLIVPLAFVNKLLENKNQLSAMEVKCSNGSNIDIIKKSIQTILGNSFVIKDRYQQQELFYKIMKTEKLAIFLILSFILLVATLNMISSITMLIVEKKKDIKILNSLGAEWNQIRKIFLYHGWLNVFLGSLLGLLLGLFLCWLQQTFGLIKLEGMSSFVIDSYPVKIVVLDILFIFITVITIGLLTAYIPIKAISQKYFSE